MDSFHKQSRFRGSIRGDKGRVFQCMSVMFIKVNRPVIELPLNPDETHPFQVIDDRASISKQFARGIKFRDLTGVLAERLIEFLSDRGCIYIVNETTREKVMRIKEKEESLEGLFLKRT